MAINFPTSPNVDDIWTEGNISWSFNGTAWVLRPAGTPSSESSKVSYAPEGTGAVDTTVEAKLRESVSVKDFGAVGDGVTDDKDSFVDFFNYIQTSGSKGYIPSGDYQITPISLDPISGDIHVECDKNAVISYYSGASEALLQTSLLQFKGASRELYRFSWVGGVIDNTGGYFVATAGSNTCLELTRLHNVQIEGVYFRGASNYVAASTAGLVGTDSGISMVDCRRASITKNIFKGQGDLGIYFGGNNSELSSDDDGGDFVITSNHFYDCYGCCSLKRGISRVVYTGNTHVNSRFGFASLQIDDVGSCRSAIVSDNIFKKTGTRAIEIGGSVAQEASDQMIITNNIIEDFGYELEADGVTLQTTANTFGAIRCLGGKDSVIADNRVYNKEWAKHANHRGISIQQSDFEIGGSTVTLYPQGLTVKNNWFSSVTEGIKASGVLATNPNKYIRNQFTSLVDTQYDSNIDNADVVFDNSGRVFANYANGGNTGTGEDTLQSITIPAGTLSRDGRALKVEMFGTSANNANSKTLKLYFGTKLVMSEVLTPSQLNRWHIEMYVVNTATGQKTGGKFVQTQNGGSGTVLNEVYVVDATEDESSDIIIKTTGEAVSDNDILHKVSIIEVS